LPSEIPDLSNESHHSLLLENDTVRVFRLKLQPGEATAVHQHRGFYAFWSLQPASFENQVRGRQPVATALEADEVRTSKGGFRLSERNTSNAPLELIVVELKKPNSGAFGTPLHGFRYHDTGFGELFEEPAVRAYELTMAVGGRTESHAENYDRLVIAETDMKLKDTAANQKPENMEMKAGAVQWIPRGITHVTSNEGTTIAKFITFEFSQ
jgi:quercetin dioxygenase-like cupin family protein